VRCSYGSRFKPEVYLIGHTFRRNEFMIIKCTFKNLGRGTPTCQQLAKSLSGALIGEEHLLDRGCFKMSFVD